MSKPNKAMPRRYGIKRNVEEYQFGTINGGGFPIRLESEKGVIKLQQTDSAKTRPLDD